MPKLLIAFASATLLLASSGIWKANAATIANAGTLAPLTKSYAPAEKVAYRHRYARRHYRRGYRRAILWLRPHYGYGYRPTRIMATATGHTAITATAGDQASPSVSDIYEVGAGATKDCATHDVRTLKKKKPTRVDGVVLTAHSPLHL